MKDKYFTLDNINDLVELFEDFLRDYGERILESDREMEEENVHHENDSLIYGMVYGDLQGRLLKHFENLAQDKVVAPVVNSWNSEVETWD